MRVKRQWPNGMLFPGLLAMLLCVSCATEKPMYLESGAHGYWISCGGYFNSWASCLEKAGRICQGRGYDTIRAEEYERNMLVTCKSPDAQTASASPPALSSAPAAVAVAPAN